MENEIKFGTDGWRGITGFDFIDEKVRVISAGISVHLNEKANLEKLRSVKVKKSGGDKPKVVIGYDTRFLSDKFAESAAEIFCKSGIVASLSDRFITTPVLSNAVVSQAADLGIMITASHNPYYYNGYKIKAAYGGSAAADIISPIESRVSSLYKDSAFVKNLNNFKYDSKYLKTLKIDFLSAYKNFILRMVDCETIKKNFNFAVLVDPMYGAGQKLFSEILSGLSSSKVFEIHSVINTYFGGINPEPIGDNLKDAEKFLKDNKCMLALCLDGDGDRIGALDENGGFVSSHHIFAVVLDYLVRRKGFKGKVIKTVTTSSIIDRICLKYGLELVVKPVGFKHISEEILSGGVIMGGEESGGLWINGYIPERDGIFMGLVLLEVLCSEKKSAGEILKGIYDNFGFFVYRRQDYEVENAKKEKIKKLLSSKVPDILSAEGAGSPITIDGFKYFLKDGSWIMLRPSGTEAVVRIYAESSSEEKLNHLHLLGRKILESSGL
ncbi:MAG: phosphoglucomutase/phosphomannomutase family protein [Actinobacteria bacterium]|nr:phosphoglucomutase/phosphomannomutase family protein [Actinomycetota bacterium]